ncbi:MAG: septal ring lytic transglycosylase RlpA family protein [Actinomycetota bacterium]|nr:septal ring lytic transglycosylase RlpA family protein [Actinomycetota bacterium]
MATTTVAAAPLLAAAAQAQTAPDIRVADSSLRYGQAAVVQGGVGAENAGRQVALEFGSADTGWRTIATTTADRAGAYAFRARLTRSGALRVAVGDTAAVRTASAAAPSDIPRSAERPVAVTARIAAPVRKLDVAAGGTALVRGTLLPGAPGRLVRLEQSGAGGRWQPIAHDRTDASGRFAVRYRVRAPGSRYVRLTFAGDRVNAATVQRIGQLSGYRPALASRYDMYGGALACGGSLGYDSLVVAHRTLPCGTKVRIRYRGRSVTATVRDRGPYSGGREFDLAGAVARRLGFDGVGTVLVAVA